MLRYRLARACFRNRRRSFESLETKQLLAGDLVASWRADSITFDEDAVQIAEWPDTVMGRVVSPVGQPRLIRNAINGRPAVRFQTLDGVDGFVGEAAVNPLGGADDFTVVVAYATDSNRLQGSDSNWFRNAGLVDANAFGFSNDWGLTINRDGRVFAGIGGGFVDPVVTVHAESPSNDGTLHVAALTRQAGDLRLYVDGVRVAEANNASLSSRSDSSFSIGKTNAGDLGFDGEIAEIRFFDGQLTDDEVAQIYGELHGYYHNERPVAVEDVYTFPEDGSIFNSFVPVADGVLANDTDPDGESLSAVLIEDVQHGKLLLSADGSLSYTADPDYFGTDQFRYTARDFRDSEPVTVTIHVTPKYDPATGMPDLYKQLSSEVLQVPAATGLLANDLNPDLVPLEVVVLRSVSQGHLTVNPDGSFTYQPMGFFGRESFSYVIRDGVGESKPVEVTIIVNTPPEARDDRFEFDEDKRLTLAGNYDLTANDFDAEGDLLTLIIVDGPEHGILETDDKGVLSYVPNENYVGDDRFTYRIEDVEDSSTVATAYLTIKPINDAPVAQPDVFFGIADQRVVLDIDQSVLENDTDVEQQPLVAQLVDGPAIGTIDFRTDGTFAFEPPNGFLGSTSFQYLADDGDSVSAPVSVTITVNSLAEQQRIVVNELHVHPDIKTEKVEFVELHNPSDVPVGVGGWALRNAVDYVFPTNAYLPAGGYLVVAQDPQDFGDKFGRSSLGPWEGKLANDQDVIDLYTHTGQQIDRVDYQLGFPWPTYGDEPGPSMQLVNARLQNDLGGNWIGALPTPGEVNAVDTGNTGPQMRRVSHVPATPGSGQPVTVQVTATDDDGVSSVTLEYQVVDPGDYIAESDERYSTQWTTIAMNDDGQAGDVAASDGVYTVVLPTDLQQHRRLIRYRFKAEDATGISQAAPYADDPQPNFAYFVYDQLPDWGAADEPGVTPEVTYSNDLLGSIPVYHLITTHESHVGSQYIPDSTERAYRGPEYQWEGTLVYDGEVYDHINFRARGGVWRYAMGKNMWKFNFERGHAFQARDDYGNEYKTRWDKLNFSSLIQQGNFQHRGEQGLFESVGFELFNLAGTESPETHYVHFRIISHADERGEDQYSGDFQGLYLAIEQPDGNFLDQHDLPDGNFYKIEGNRAESTVNQGADQVDDATDVNENFIRKFRRSEATVDWWREMVDLDRYYGYQAISHGIHHYDTAFGKNFYYYHNPDTDKMQIHPWDLDLTWADNMYGNEGHEFNMLVAKNEDFNDYSHTANIELENTFNADYQNRVREILDLLFTPEQVGMLIDQVASIVYQPGARSFVDADRAMWDHNPITSVRTKYTDNSKNAVSWKYYQKAETKDFPGMIKILKDYVVKRNTWIRERVLTNEVNIPLTPQVEHVGASFELNDLTFQTSEFESPIGAEFVGMEWRIAATTDVHAPDFDPYDRTEPRIYEINALWESGVVSEFQDAITIPAHHLVAGETYRVRVRMLDDDDHWSHWSEPVQFVARPETDPEINGSLRISEIHFNPVQQSAVEIAAGMTDKDEFEFIELVNIGQRPIDLSSVKLVRIDVEGQSQGVDFSFADGSIAVLGPGSRAVVVENQEAFALRYGKRPVAGQWRGGLSNNGELITITSNGTIVQQVRYEDDWHPATDGDGPSLEIVDPSVSDLSKWSEADAWRPSQFVGGTPGMGPKTDHVPGDANRDGVFDSLDLVDVFARGEYEDDILGNSSWEDGDWNQDGDFNSEDIVFAFQFGAFVPHEVPSMPLLTPATSDSVFARIWEHDREQNNKGATKNRELGLAISEELLW